MATPHPSRCTCDLRAGGGEKTCQYPHPPSVSFAEAVRQAHARRLALTLPCPRCGDTADRDGCDFCAGTGRVGSTIARSVGRTS